MKRKTRPLDPLESRTVQITAPLDLVPLEQPEDYMYRWPDAPLTRYIQLVMNAAARGSDGEAAVKGGGGSVALRVASSGSSFSASIPLSLRPQVEKPPITEQQRDPHEASTATSSALASDRIPDLQLLASSTLDNNKNSPFVENLTDAFFVLPYAWIEQLETTFSNLQLNFSDDATVQTILERFIIVTETAAQGIPITQQQITALDTIGFDACYAKALSVLGLTEHSCAVPRSVMEFAFNLWTGNRMLTASTERPWGTPLVPGLVEYCAGEEFFVSWQAPLDMKYTELMRFGCGAVGGSPRSGQKTPSSGAAGKGGGGDGTRTRATGQAAFWYLPYEVPLDWKSRVSRVSGASSPSGTMRKCTMSNAQQVLASLPPLNVVKLNKIDWGVHDIDAEVREMGAIFDGMA